ncbi:MAG: calcium-binding protein, partial [Pseudomonadota bacterium]
MFNVTSGTTSGVAQSTVNAILSLTQQAAAAWAPYLNFGGSSLEIEVEIVPIDGNTLAFGGTTFFTLTSGPFAGFFQASPVLELANGTDPNGAMPDITISIDLETLQAGDFHLGGPDVGGPVPGLFDLYTVLIHEIGHGLGHLGFGDDPDVQSVFDSFVTVDDGSLFFTGPETASINSGPLRLSDDSHVQFVNDLMSASIGRGQRQSISDINISVLQDIGMPILLPTNNDDVLQGFEFATLAPGVTSGDDIIDLLGGNDTYFGLSGNDVVSGGAGDDTVFGGLGADDIRGDADEDFLFGGSGDDVLTGGAGSDTFVFLADEDHDIITDFSGGSSG